jgi:hypothetical protein
VNKPFLFKAVFGTSARDALLGPTSLMWHANYSETVTLRSINGLKGDDNLLVIIFKNDKPLVE